MFSFIEIFFKIEYNYFRKETKKMKKKIIITIFALILLAGCSSKENKETYEIYKIYKLNEETTIYSTTPNPQFINKNGDKVNLKEGLNSNLISIEDIISLMELYTVANDGGTQIYKSENQNFYLAKCNSLPENGGIKDIILSNNIDKIASYCTK